MKAREIAEALNARKTGRGWLARCPAHDDKRPSLSIGESNSGKLLIHCFGGCSFEMIIAQLSKLGLERNHGNN